MSRPLALRLKYFAVEHFATSRDRLAFVERNLDMVGVALCVLVLLVMERVTALFPPS